MTEPFDPPLSARTDEELAQLLEEAARRLRSRPAKSGRPVLGKAARSAAQPPASENLPRPSRPVRTEWQPSGTIKEFNHRFPEVHEHFTDMAVHECRDGKGRVVFALGVPKERMEIYGRDRGWLSIWNVINGTPRDLRAVFIECDDFAESGDRAALIYGRDGRSKGLYSSSEVGLLPAIYRAARIEVQRDRCQGPYAKNRLALIARDSDVELMLDHALHNHRLREARSA